MISLAQGAVNTLDFEVVGVFQSFSKDFDARAVRIPLAAARDLMDTQAAHLIVVVLNQTEDTDRIFAALRQTLAPRGYELASWRELSDFYDKTVQLYESQFGVLRLIILLMVLLSVANSVNMTLFERTREFGTLLALGDRPGRVFALIISESLLLGLFGAGLGMALGSVLAWAISAIGIPMPPPPGMASGFIGQILVAPGLAFDGLVLALVTTFLASVAPAWKASRMNIVDALRYNQ